MTSFGAVEQEYRERGAVCLRACIGSNWLTLLARGLERNLSEPGPYAKTYTPAGASGLFFGDYCNWSRIPEYREFLFNSPAPGLAGRLMAARSVCLFHEHVLVKEPGTLEPTPWHQDQPYWCVDGEQVCSLWIPLDPVPRETCPEFVAGSHRWGTWFTPTRFVDGRPHPAEDGAFVPVPDIEAERERHHILGWDLEPGDCIAFHALTLHGAPGNPLPTRRRAFAARYVGDDARFAIRPGFMSPPPPPGSPAPGAPMEGAAFPRVWSRAD